MGNGPPLRIDIASVLGTPCSRMAKKQDIRSSLANRLPFFYGWVIVAAAFVGAFAGGGLQSFTFSVFMKPMSESLGWTRVTLTGALTVRTYAGAVLAPVFGVLVDKHGPRYLMVFAAIVGGVAAVLISRVQEIWQFYVIFALVGLAGGTGVGGVITQATVVKWFVRLRGRAVAFSTMGNSAAGFVLAPLIGVVIVAIGWRSGWLILAAIFFFILIPIAFLMARQPEDMGLLPDGAKSEEEMQTVYHQRSGRESMYSWTLKEALRTKALWILLVAQIIGGFPVSSVVLHEYSYVTDSGFSTAIAAAVLSTHAAAASIARLVWGFLVERFHVRYCLAASNLGAVLGIGILLFALNIGSTPMLFVFALVYGLNIGSHGVLTTVATANYFGRDFIGTIRGVLAPITTASVALGPVMVSLVYDVRGTYFPAFAAMLAMFFISAVVVLFATPPTKETPVETTPVPTG